MQARACASYSNTFQQHMLHHAPRRNFGRNFCLPRNFCSLKVFFSPKNGFDAEVMEKIATKTTLLFFGNICPRIASHAFLTIWDPLKWAKINLSENQIFRIFQFFRKIEIFSKIDFAYIYVAICCHHIATLFSNICCCAPPRRNFGRNFCLPVEISADFDMQRPGF